MAQIKNIFFVSLFLVLTELQFGFAEEHLQQTIDSRNILRRNGRYIMYGMKASQYLAAHICNDNDAVLVSIDNEFVKMEVAKLLLAENSEGGWTSGRSLKKGVFVWTSTNQPLANDDKSWVNEYHAKNKEGCVYLGGSDLGKGLSLLVEPDCTTQYHVICDLQPLKMDV